MPQPFALVYVQCRSHRPACFVFSFALLHYITTFNVQSANRTPSHDHGTRGALSPPPLFGRNWYIAALEGNVFGSYYGSGCQDTLLARPPLISLRAKFCASRPYISLLNSKTGAVLKCNTISEEWATSRSDLDAGGTGLPDMHVCAAEQRGKSGLAVHRAYETPACARQVSRKLILLRLCPFACAFSSTMHSMLNFKIYRPCPGPPEEEG
jgi:hypothetical protein